MAFGSSFFARRDAGDMLTCVFDELCPQSMGLVFALSRLTPGNEYYANAWDSNGDT